MLNCRRSKLNVLGSSPRQHKTHVRYTIAFLKHVSPKLTAQLLFVCLIEGAISHECYYIITYRFRIASLIAKCANINDHWKSLRLSNAHIQNAFSFSDVTSRHNSHHEKRQHQTKGPQNHGSLYHSRRFWSAIKSRSAECAADIWRLLSSTRMARVVSYGPSSGWCTIYIYIFFTARVNIIYNAQRHISSRLLLVIFFWWVFSRFRLIVFVVGALVNICRFGWSEAENNYIWSGSPPDCFWGLCVWVCGFLYISCA